MKRRFWRLSGGRDGLGQNIAAEKARKAEGRTRCAAGAVVEQLEERTLLSVFFAPRQDYATGRAPRAVTAADFNGDGAPDLVAANSLASSVSVLLNNGDGTFADKVDIAVGNGPTAVAAADLDRDGDMDLVVVNKSDNTVSVLLGNADGTFAAPVTYATGATPVAVVAADLNGDSAPDLVVANSGANTVSVLLNNGFGAFAGKVDYAAGASPVALTAADFNGGTGVDLAIACNDAAGTVRVLVNGGDGTFTFKADYTMGHYCSSIASANFSGDATDLAVAQSGADTVSVLTGNGDGTFGGQTDYATEPTPMSVVAGDFDGDGKSDLAVSSFGNKNVRVLRNDGGTLVNAGDYSTADGSLSLTTADFNEDGALDIAAVNTTTDVISVLENLPATTAVQIADVHLEGAIRWALVKATGAITIADMQTLVSLDAPSLGISNLSGLQYATNLTQLDLSHNQIADLAALGGLLGLTSLDISSNSVLVLAPLANLTAMTTLKASGNQILGADALSGMTHLTTLDLDGNAITSASPLAGLTALTELRLHNNAIGSAQALSGMTQLTTLDLGGTHLTDVQALAGMTAMQWLDVSNNVISDITSLAGLTGVKHLNVSMNNIVDNSAVAAISALVDVDMTRNLLDLRDHSVPRTVIAALQQRGVAVSYLPQSIQAAPSGVAASSALVGKIHLSWVAPLGAAGYEVWRSTSNNSATASQITTQYLTGTSYDDASAQAGVQYWYWIKAYNGIATSGFGTAAQGYRVPLDLVGETLAITSPLDVLPGGLVVATRSYQVDGAPGSFYINYRLSTDTLWGNSDDIPIDQYELISQASDRSAGLHTGSMRLAVPWTAAARTYYLLARVDSTLVVSEDNEVNNVAVSNSYLQVKSPVNDSFSARLPMTGASVSTAGSNGAATQETLEPWHAGYAGGHSVWWTWTAPDSGQATIDTIGSSFDTLLGVYVGKSVSALSYVASNNDISASNKASSATFRATRGQSYQIAVDGCNGAMGLITLNVNLKAGVQDDTLATFSPSAAWPVMNGNYQGKMHYAPAGAGSSTATWTFYNLVNGPYYVSTSWLALSNVATNTPFGVYDGSKLLGTVMVNQKLAPKGTSYDGVTWQGLGSFSIASGTMSIKVSNNANAYVLADAVRIEYGVLDDAQAALSLPGSWYTMNGSFQGSMHYAVPGTGSSTASWTFNNLASGTYRVSATWLALSNVATNAPFSVYDGTRLLGTVVVNQRVNPPGGSYDGMSWQLLGSNFTISTGSLTVKLGNNANGYVLADAVRIEKMS